MPTHIIYGIVPAGGIGKRMNASKPKQFLTINDKPILIITLAKLASSGLISNFIIPSVDIVYTKKILKSYLPDLDCIVIKSGKTRQESVYNALLAIKEMPSPDFVLVHDAVRALVTEDVINRVILKAKECGAAIAAKPVTDTLKLSQINKQGNLTIKKNISRDMMWQAQTPQVYSQEIIFAAYQKAQEEKFIGTDSAGLVERLGIDVALVESPLTNIKITTQEDLNLAQLLML